MAAASSFLAVLLCVLTLLQASVSVPLQSSSLSSLLTNQPAADLQSRAVNESEAQIVVDFPIHSSCNASQALQLRRGLFDLKRVTRAAADYILLHGNSSELFITYFGEAGDPAIPLGIYERILNVSC